MTMIRKQVYIDPDQERKLKSLSRRLGVTEAELIRRAIDGLALEAEPSPGYPESLAPVFELARRLRETLPLSNGGRTWTRDELYDDPG